MRIVAGKFRGKKLLSPRGMDIRPTGDRVREALFSMLGTRVSGAHVLDLFAGSGALGLEALSRGARKAVFVDRSPEAVELIKRNIALCRAEGQSQVILSSCEKAVQRLHKAGAVFQLIFLDPPYGQGHGEKALGLVGSLLHADGLAVLESHVKDATGERLHGCLRIKERKYGDTLISMYVRETCGGGCGCSGG